MIKKLAKIGDSHAIYLDKTLLDSAGADDNTEFKISNEGNRIVLEAMPEIESQEQFLKDAEQVMEAHASVLKKLAE